MSKPDLQTIVTHDFMQTSGGRVLLMGPKKPNKPPRALARQLELDLQRIDLARVVNQYIGETEKNLRRLFDAAQKSGAILYLDEADALFGKRSEVKDAHDRYANTEMTYLRQRIEEHRGLIIVAVKEEMHLDAAFLRKFQFIIRIPPKGE